MTADRGEWRVMGFGMRLIWIGLVVVFAASLVLAAAGTGRAAPARYTVDFEVKSPAGKSLWSDKLKCNIGSPCELKGKVMIDGQPRDLVVRTFYFGLEILKVQMYPGNAVWKPNDGSWALPIDDDLPLVNGAEKRVRLSVPDKSQKAFSSVEKANVTLKVAF